MLKVLVNPNIFEHFSEIDPSNSDYRKGIDLLPNGYKWMSDQTQPCDVTGTYKKFCNSYTNYNTF